MKNIKSRTSTRLSDEHLETCIQTTTTEIKPHIETFILFMPCSGIRFTLDNQILLHVNGCNSPYAFRQETIVSGKK
jgi:hypothetical protein